MDAWQEREIREKYKRGKVGIIAGGAMMLAGAAGVYFSTPHVEAEREELRLLNSQLWAQEQTLASLDADVASYWENLTAGKGRVLSLSVKEQIDAYFVTARIFPQMKLADDAELRAKIDEATQAAYQVGVMKRQVTTQQQYLKGRDGWSGIQIISATFGLLLGFIVLVAAGGNLYDAVSAQKRQKKPELQKA